MRESTRVLLKKHGWRIDRALHNYIYFRWYYPYVKAVAVFLKPLNYLAWLKPLKYFGKITFSRYHSKFLSAGDISKILTLNEDVRLVSDSNKRIIPYKYAHRIIFQDPEFIVVMDCPCKKSFNAPADTINSCIVVGSGTGRFWLESCGKYNPRQISQQEAIELVKKFRSEGYITQAFFKVATGGSTGVICNCHPDTCVSLKATELMKRVDRGVSMNAESGYSVKRDEKLCVKCGACVSVCHFNAMSPADEFPAYKSSECMGCGLCVEACSGEALTLYADPRKSIPLDMDFVKKEIG